MYPYPSCIYTSYWYEYCLYTFMIRVLSKSVINIDYQSVILISIAIAVSPVTLYLATRIKKTIRSLQQKKVTLIQSFTILLDVSHRSISQQEFLHKYTDTFRYNIYFLLRSIKQQWKVFNVVVCVRNTVFRFRETHIINGKVFSPVTHL